MKSITIHKLDSKTAQLIEQKAKETGLSLNKTIKMLLHKALGISQEQINHSEDFKEFLGLWNKAEFEDFEEKTNDFNQIAKDEWK